MVQVDVNNVEHLWAPALQSFKKMHQEPRAESVMSSPSEGQARDTVLVTGGTGYLGSLVVARLAAAGVPVVALDIRDPREPVDGVEYITGDLRTVDLAALFTEHQVGAVVHLAAIVEPPKGMTEQELGTSRWVAQRSSMPVSKPAWGT